MMLYVLLGNNASGFKKYADYQLQTVREVWIKGERSPLVSDDDVFEIRTNCTTLFFKAEPFQSLLLKFCLYVSCLGTSAYGTCPNNIRVVVQVWLEALTETPAESWLAG